MASPVATLGSTFLFHGISRGSLSWAKPKDHSLVRSEYTASMASHSPSLKWRRVPSSCLLHVCFVYCSVVLRSRFGGMRTRHEQGAKRKRRSTEQTRHNCTRYIAQLYRHTGAITQRLLHNCTGIPAQIHKGYCTTAQAYRCNCTRGIAQLHRHTGATAQGVLHNCTGILVQLHKG